MKRYAFWVLCFVLTAMLMVGCGCTNQKMDSTAPSTAPSILPTNEEAWKDTSVPTTTATVPTTTATQPSETADRGNGALEDPTSSSADAVPNETVTGRIRQSIPNMN